MLKRAAVLSLIVLAGAASAGASTLITFDDSPVGTLTAGTVLTNQYQSLGVVFTGFENDVEVPTYVDRYWGLSPAGDNYWSNDWSGHSMDNQRRDIVEIRFLAPVSNVSFDYFNTYSQESVVVNLYNSSDALIGSTGIASYSYVPLDLSAYADIAYIQLLQQYDDFAFLMDNLRFDVSSPTIPAPAALLLGTLGTGLVGWLRGRKTL